MFLSLFALALADDAAMDMEDCGPSIDLLYPRDGDTEVAIDAVPTVLIANADCGGLVLDLVLIADGEIVAQRSVESDDHLVELDAELLPGTDYQFQVYLDGRDTASGESRFSTGNRPASPGASTPAIVRGNAAMYDENGEVYVEVTVSAVPGGTVIGLAPWDGAGELGDPADVADASAQRNLGLSMLGPQVGDEVCVGAMARGLDGSWSSAATECFVVAQGWSDVYETWVDDHDHACNAASAAMGLAPILLGTLGILRRRAR